MNNAAIFKLIKFRNFEVKNLILPHLVGAAGSEDHESKNLGGDTGRGAQIVDKPLRISIGESGMVACERRVTDRNAKVTHVSFQWG